MTQDKAETPPRQEIEAECRERLEERIRAALKGNAMMLISPDRAHQAVTPLSAYVMSTSVDRQEASTQRQEALLERQGKLMKDMHRQARTMTRLTWVVVIASIFVVFLSVVQIWSTGRSAGNPPAAQSSSPSATQPIDVEAK